MHLGPAGFNLALLVLAGVGAHAAPSLPPPYLPSPVIKSLVWDEQVLKVGKYTGDNWSITWVEGDLQITSWGDGPGFDEKPPRLSLGFARIFGDPPNVRGEDFSTDIDTPQGGGSSAIKTSGLLLVDGVLYMWVRNYRPPGSDDYTNARLGWSKNRGTNWTWADWHFADTFGCPEFLQFGPNYAGARDDYVYIASQANDSAYGYSPDIVLARMPKRKVPNRDSYEFFAGFNSVGESAWSGDIQQRKPIFTDPNGTQRIAITYNAGLKRYVLTTSHRPPGSKATHTAALGVFDAPEPWGPWTTVSYQTDWSGTNRSYHHKFPTRWMSLDGRTMWLLYSGLDGDLYSFCLKKATLRVSETSGTDESGFLNLLSGEALKDWRQCGPGRFLVQNGVATGEGGMGLWWFAGRQFTNFVLRGEFVQEQEIADSGVFVRFPDPKTDPWIAVNQGHEMEIGDPNPQDPTWRTGSIYPLAASSKANTKPLGEWNQYEIVCRDQTYTVTINGEIITTWTDPKKRTRSGYIGLQNYNDDKTVRHRNLGIKDLP
jgi:hypothetical protein